MPELPEVETIAEDLRHSGILHKKIVAAKVLWHKTVDMPALKEFNERVKGQTIDSISRRGKYIVFKLTNDWIYVHLRMTGRFKLESPEEPHAKHERLYLSLSNSKELRYIDTRKFGRWSLTNDPDVVVGDLGIEPLGKEFTLAAFKVIVNKSTMKIKPLILDQTKIAGIGNIYADESLWESKIHPERKSNSLTLDEIKALHKAIPKVLKKGLASQGTTLGKTVSNYYRLDGSSGKNKSTLKVYNRTGQLCERCGSKIVRKVIAQRSSHFCPTCQK
jgi:formamidopyrimidine-DNA glycosylase